MVLDNHAIVCVCVCALCHNKCFDKHVVIDICAGLSIIFQAFTKSNWILTPAYRCAPILIFPSHDPQRFRWSSTCSCSSPWSGCGQVFIWATSSFGCSSSTSSLTACWWAFDFLFLAWKCPNTLSVFIALAEIITDRSTQIYAVFS